MIPFLPPPFSTLEAWEWVGFEPAHHCFLVVSRPLLLLVPLLLVAASAFEAPLTDVFGFRSLE